MTLWGKSHHKHILKLNTIKVEASDDVLLLGITIDKKLTFKQHIENLLESAVYASCIETYKKASHNKKG